MSHRTEFVLTVREPAEVPAALAAEPSIIDIKEPARGSLGRPDADSVRAIIAAVDGRRSISVADGELCETTAALDFSQLPTGIEYAKVGLAACGALDWQPMWKTWREALPSNVEAVAVIYADWQSANTPPPAEIIRTAPQLGFTGLLVDTHSKSQGSLFRVSDVDQIKQWLSLANTQRLWTALAGSLTDQDIPTAVSLSPRYLAIRSAACSGDRVSQLCQKRARATGDAIRAANYLVAN